MSISRRRSGHHGLGDVDVTVGSGSDSNLIESWTADLLGVPLIGRYGKRRSKKFKDSWLIDLISDDGSRRAFPMGAVLTSKLDGVDEGSLIEIAFLGRKPSEKGEYPDFRVRMHRPDTNDNGAPAAATTRRAIQVPTTPTSDASLGEDDVPV